MVHAPSSGAAAAPWCSTGIHAERSNLCRCAQRVLQSCSTCHPNPVSTCFLSAYSYTWPSSVRHHDGRVGAAPDRARPRDSARRQRCAHWARAHRYVLQRVPGGRACAHRVVLYASLPLPQCLRYPTCAFAGYLGQAVSGLCASVAGDQRSALAHRAQAEGLRGGLLPCAQQLAGQLDNPAPKSDNALLTKTDPSLSRRRTRRRSNRLCVSAAGRSALQVSAPLHTALAGHSAAALRPWVWVSTVRSGLLSLRALLEHVQCRGHWLRLKARLTLALRRPPRADVRRLAALRPATNGALLQTRIRRLQGRPGQKGRRSLCAPPHQLLC
jgi:hypothetical protein